MTTEPEQKPSPGGFYNVAIYSDDSALVIQFASCFQGVGYYLTLARRRDEVMRPEVLAELDLLLIDDVLAALDTWNIARLVRQQIPGNRPVACIGFVDALNAELMLQGRELGIDAFLLKSAAGPELADRINFIARRVERRAGTSSSTLFLPHTEFLKSLRDQIEIVAAPRTSTSSTPGAARSSSSGPPGTTAGRVTRFKRGSSSPSSSLKGERKLPDLSGQLFGKVRIEKELGRGGGGVVFSGHHTSLDMRVAVKVLYPNLADRDPEFAAQFLAEARLAARISDGSVVRVFDCDREDESGLYYIIMEFVEGTDLQEEIKRAGTVPEERLLELALETSHCLMAAEELGIIHRDIKPANILLTRTGMVKVADLGLAKRVETAALGAGRLSRSSRISKGPLVGTPYYMSPEQIENSPDIDSRTDIYSLGATLYHAATGQVPFTGEDMGEILMHHLHTDPPLITDRKPEVSAEFGRIVQKMMGKRPRQRYSSMREVHGVFRSHRDFLVIKKSRASEEKEKGSRSGIFPWKRPSSGG